MRKIHGVALSHAPEPATSIRSGAFIVMFSLNTYRRTLTAEDAEERREQERIHVKSLHWFTIHGSESWWYRSFSSYVTYNFSSLFLVRAFPLRPLRRARTRKSELKL